MGSKYCSGSIAFFLLSFIHNNYGGCSIRSTDNKKLSCELFLNGRSLKCLCCVSFLKRTYCFLIKKIYIVPAGKSLVQEK